MPPLSPEKLRILTFPQRINGDQLEVNALLLPTQKLLYVQTSFPSQLSPGTTVSLPKFITADVKLQLKAIKGLSTYPFSDPFVLHDEGVTVDPLATTIEFPLNLPLLYEGLASQFKLDPAAPTQGTDSPWADADGIRKYLPVSYRTAFNFILPRTEFAKTDDSYHCAIRKSPPPDPTFNHSGDDVTWGRIIAICLRHPSLAERIGLLHRTTITLPAADYFQNGGWIYFALLSNPADFDIP